MICAIQNDDKSTTTLMIDNCNNKTATKQKSLKTIGFYGMRGPSAILHQEQHEVEHWSNTHKKITQKMIPNELYFLFNFRQTICAL